MLYKTAINLGLAALAMWGAACDAAKPEPAKLNAQFCPAAGDANITNLLVPIREKHHVPAMAAAVVTSKGLIAVGVVGIRKQGTKIAATLEDQWHLGSETKAMTAALAARLVEQGRLKWDTTLADAFPEWTARLHPDFRGVTLRQLLTHRSGLPPNPNLLVYRNPDGREDRLRLVKNELGKSPSRKPGSFEYSNLGYAIAGAIMEKMTDTSWDQLMQTELFKPLGMASAGFGGTGTPGLVDQPWGHRANGKPVDGNGPTVDNPPVLGPAGRVHCTIQDWAKFVADQLRGARGADALLKPASYQTLHTPPPEGEYAMGWLVLQRDWGGGVVLHHGGDNTMNHANVWIAPNRDFAILACVNQSGDTAFQASDAAISALIKNLSKFGIKTH